MFGLNLKLKKMNPLSGVAGKETVAVEFSGSLLRLAYVKTFGDRRDVVSLVTRKVSGLSDGDVVKALTAAFHGLKAKNPEIAYVIPSNLVITKNIEIPSVDPKEIKEIINLQAGRHTPYSREEIIVDYIDIGTFKHSYTKILLVIVARNTLKKQFDVVERAGLRLDKVLLSPEGIGRGASRMLSMDTSASPACIIHVDGANTDFMIISKSRLAYLRAIPIGAEQLAGEKGKYEMKFAEEVKRSLEAYQGENIDASPGAVVVTGAVEEISDINKALSDAIQVPVRTAPYNKGIIISQEAEGALAGSKRVSFLGIIAPLYAWDELKVDLIPDEIKLRKALEERGRELIKTGIFILSLFVILCVIFITKIYFKTAYLKILSAKYQSLGQESQKLEASFAKVSLVRNYMASRGLSLEALSELYKSIPMEVELNDIRYDEQGKVNMRGTAETMSAVFSFVNALDKSKSFKDVKTKYTSKRKEGTKDVTDFEILSALEKGR